MHRPEDLFDSVENDAIARLFAFVICSETAVVRWMPIFGRDDDIEASLQFICKRDDLITMRYRQGAARQKIILKIDKDQRVHIGCSFRATTSFVSLFSIRLAPKALFHISLGASPQEFKSPRKPALKERFTGVGNDSRFQRWCLGTMNPGAMPQACDECSAFGANTYPFSLRALSLAKGEAKDGVGRMPHFNCSLAREI